MAPWKISCDVFQRVGRSPRNNVDDADSREPLRQVDVAARALAILCGHHSELERDGQRCGSGSIQLILSLRVTHRGDETLDRVSGADLDPMLGRGVVEFRQRGRVV